MKILLLNSILSTPVRGTIIPNRAIKDCMIYSIAIGLKKAGHEVTLIAAEEYHPHEDTDEFEVIYMRCGLKKLFRPDLLPYHPDLWIYLWSNRHTFDMILTSEAFSMVTFQTVMCARKKSVIWQELTQHNRLFKKIPSRIWYNLIVRFLFRGVLIVPRSKPAFKFITRFSRTVSDEIVDNGVNISRFPYSLEKEDYFIIFCKLIPRKRVDEMIKRFALFVRRKEYAHYCLHIVGDGPLEKGLRDLVFELGIPDSVFFKGFMNHNRLNEELRKAVALLVFTNNDLNMVSITESIVSGTPVLTNSVPASVGLIIAHNLGIVKDDWSVPELVKMIEKKEEYSANCRKIRNYLSNEIGVKRLVDLFYKHLNQYQ